MTSAQISYAQIEQDRNRVWLKWLVRLRWVAITAQFVTLLITFRLFQSGYLAFAFGVSGLLVVVNVLSYQRLISATPIRQPTLFLQLCVDISALNAFFFLVVAMKILSPRSTLSMSLSPRSIFEFGWVLAVSSLVIGSYSAVHYAHYPLELQREGWDQVMIVPFGRIISYIATTGSIAAFVMAIASSQRHQERALHASRERTARTDRLRPWVRSQLVQPMNSTPH